MSRFDWFFNFNLYIFHHISICFYRNHIQLYSKKIINRKNGYTRLGVFCLEYISQMSSSDLPLGHIGASVIDCPGCFPSGGYNPPPPSHPPSLLPFSIKNFHSLASNHNGVGVYFGVPEMVKGIKSGKIPPGLRHQYNISPHPSPSFPPISDLFFPPFSDLELSIVIF